MNKKLYALMDWAKIEELVYGECDRPDDFLGAHAKGRQTLVQAFFPGAGKVTIYVEGSEGSRGRTVREEVPMELADEAGFFAALLPGGERKEYRYHAEYPVPEEDGKKKKKKESISRDFPELYGFGTHLSEEEETRFASGAETGAYTYMGAHKKTLRGKRGCIFRVWAPEAVRVSLVGDFNEWDARRCPMNRLEGSGIFELFVPGLEEGEHYAYDVLMKGGVSMRKADPYSFRQAGPHSADSVFCAPSRKWKDERWMDARKKYDPSVSPLNIYALSLERLPEGFLSDKTAVAELADYLSSMAYTHVELMPLMEFPGDQDAGYHSSLLFAPSSRYGSPEELMAFVDVMHGKNIGVLLEWAPGDFSNAEFGPGSFDGSALYEYADPRRGVEPRTGMLKFDLGKTQVQSYLLSVLNFWSREHHVDGFVTLDVASLLYLDYYRAPGEWIPNIYGGVENLEAIAFLREMNVLLHKAKSGLISIASGSSSFPKVTEKGDEGLGFDLTSDSDCVRELIDYLSRDPIVRRNYHHALVGSMLYQYCENYLLPVGLSHVNFRQGGLRMRMHGDEAEQWKGLKLLYAYLCLHVGKWAVFEGQEYGNLSSFEDMERRMPCDKQELEEEVFRAYLKSLNGFYAKESALYACDNDENGFVWLKEDGAEENVLAFLRQDVKKGRSLVCVFNFANVDRDKYFLGVDREGKYKEIFSSESGGVVDGPTTAARRSKTDGRDYRIRLVLPALSAKVYLFQPFTAEEKAEIRRREEERARKRREEEERRKDLAAERSRLRESLKEELARKIRAAEQAIAAGSETKGKKKK